MTSLALVALALVVLVGGYLAFARKKNVANPDRTVAEAWQHCLGPDDSRTGLEKEGARYLAAFEEEESLQLRTRLEASEERLAGSHGMRCLRERIMDVTDRFLFAEAVIARQHKEDEEPNEQLETLYRQRLAQAVVLRCLAGERYADRAAEDWYTHYVKLARLNVANVAAMVDRTTHGDQPELESSIHKRLMDSISQVRTELLDHPPRQPVRTHTPISVQSVDPRATAALTPLQLEQLANLMKGRLTRILLGELYVDGQTLLEPGRAFELDAALLYVLLADRMEDAGPEWRRVVELSLSEGDGLAHDIERLEQQGQRLRSVWQQHAGGGPLQQVLAVGYAAACGEASGKESASVPLGVVEDAGGLLRDVQAIMGRS